MAFKSTYIIDYVEQKRPVRTGNIRLSAIQNDHMWIERYYDDFLFRALRTKITKVSMKWDVRVFTVF